MPNKTVTIEAGIPLQEPPAWAILERRLIELINQAIEPVLEKYLRPDGSVMWPTREDHKGIDALDDAYESFHNWPLFYMLGGDDKFLALSHRSMDAVTRQFTRYDCGHGHPMVVKEYEQGYDWFHQGEGYLFFYLLCLADPANPVNLNRARRFAGFYLNEDPEALNYDPELKLLRSPHVGSMGPAHRNFTGAPWYYTDGDWKRFYGMPFQDICSCSDDLADPQTALRMGQAMKERFACGDVAVNLSATSLVANAFLLTGEEKYRSWVLDYIGAWWERAAANGGVMPDNVGLSGRIGECFSGKWYGGNYGWTWPHGWRSVGDAVLIAAENAVLLSRDPSWLDVARFQLDTLINRGIVSEGTLHTPYKYGDPGFYHYDLWIENVLRDDDGSVLWRDGWFEFQPMDPRHPAHLWSLSQEERDLERLRLIRNSFKHDWEMVVSVKKKDQGGHEAAWVSFLAGEYPGYPEDILKHNLSQVYDRLDFMRHDDQDPATYGDAYLQRRNPVTAEGLMQLTMGGPLPIYNGGLLQARVRHFDCKRRRPGLPPDTAALIEEIGEDRIVLRLVNLGAVEESDMLIQAGAFGEHRFTGVAWQDRRGEETVTETAEITGSHLRVRLQPGCEVRLELGMERFVNEPRAADPFEVGHD